MIEGLTQDGTLYTKINLSGTTDLIMINPRGTTGSIIMPKRRHRTSVYHFESFVSYIFFIDLVLAFHQNENWL